MSKTSYLKVSNPNSFLSSIDSGVNAPLYTDNTSYNVNTGKTLTVGMMYDDISPNVLTEGNLGVPRQSANRNQYIQIRDSSTEVSAGVKPWNELMVSSNVTASTLPTGASTEAKQDTANGLLTTIETNTEYGAITGGGVQAGALRVTLATDSSGSIEIDEFPVAAVITDNFANPSTTSVMGMNMVFNGVNWDRAPGSASDGMLTTAILSATDNAVLDSIATNTTDSATETTLALLNGKVTKCDTDNVTFDANVFQAFVTSTNLGGTAINNGAGYTAGETTSFTVTSTADFPAGGLIRINDEIISYTSKTATTFDTLARGVYGTTAEAIVDADSVGELFDSGIKTLDGYSQVITKIQSDQDCQMLFEWYSDLAGTKLIRTLAPNFLATDGYDYLSTVAFGPYVRYTIAPGNTTTTEMFFTTEFSNRSTQPQLFTIDSGVFSSMVGQLSRSVLVGYDSINSLFNNVEITPSNELLTNTLASSKSGAVAMSEAAIVANTYGVLVDLSDTTNFPHNETTSLSIDQITASVVFSTGTADAIIKVGLITRIDGTDSDIDWLLSIPYSAQNANTSLSTVINYQPSSLTFNNNAINAITNDTSTSLTAVNTGSSLTSPNGSIAPALGDIIVLFEYVADEYNSTISCVYHSD